MLNILNGMMAISLIVIVVCTFVIIHKFIRYFDNKKKTIDYQKNNAQDIKILESKLEEIKLKNTGYSLDKNIEFIYSDKDVMFSMGWEDILE